MLPSIFIFLRQVDPEELYSKEPLNTLRQVEKFLANADEITTMAADRVLTSDSATATARAKLLAGTSLTSAVTKQSNGSRTAVLTGNDRKLAVEFFKSLTKLPIQGPAKCFFPRHSIFARSKANWLEIQICYECVTMRITSKDNSIKLYTGINRNSRDLADKFFGYKSKNSKA